MDTPNPIDNLPDAVISFVPEAAHLPTILSIVAFFIGQRLVTRKRWTGFLVWALSNSLLTTHLFLDGNTSTALMFLVYAVVNFRSMLLWLRDKRPLAHSECSPSFSLAEPGPQM